MVNLLLAQELDVNLLDGLFSLDRMSNQDAMFHVAHPCDTFTSDILMQACLPSGKSI